MSCNKKTQLPSLSIMHFLFISCCRFSSQKSQAAKAVPRPSFSPSNLYGATLFVNLLNEDCITGETCDLYGNALPEDSELETKEEILNLVQEIGETDFQCQVPICSTIIPQHC